MVVRVYGGVDWVVAADVQCVFQLLPLRLIYPLHTLSVLDEANILGILTEALTAHVEAVLPDEAMLVAAYTALAPAFGVVLGVRAPHLCKAHGC